MTYRLIQRPLFWQLPYLIPLLLVAIWLIQPGLDLRLPPSETNPLQNPTHFWIVSSAGVVSLLLGLQMSVAAQHRKDARLFLVAMSILSAAGFTLLHALATPNILVAGRNIGFVIAAPVGLIIASGFAAVSASTLSVARAATILRRQHLIRGGLLIFIAIFTTGALLRLPPFTFIPNEDLVRTPILFCLIGIAPAPVFQGIVTPILLLATVLFGWAAGAYFRLFTERPNVVVLGLGSAFVGLALTTLNLGLARTWRLTWWQWHILLLVAFGLMAYSAYRQFRKEGDSRQIYDSVMLEETIQRVRSEYTSALELLVETLRRRAETGDETPLGPVAARMAHQFALSDGQLRVLEQAAEALAQEREQIKRLSALVAVGQETRIIIDEQQLLEQALSLTQKAFARDHLRIGLLGEGTLVFSNPHHMVSNDAEDDETINTALKSLKPAERAGHLVVPLTVKGIAAGVLEARRSHGRFADRERYLLQSLASQLSVALENARLYRQIDVLFRQYMPTEVVKALLADPSQAALGGAVTEVSVLFGDLRGFTSLAERMSPPELVTLLNTYFGAASYEVLAQGGTIDKFMGDAMMALFNTPTRQPDHALRACRAALAMQRVITPLAAQAEDMPRFGIGIHSGDALVGNIGSEAIRNFTAIGDTVNLASRLQTRAEGGQVLISSSTYAQVKEHVHVRPLGALQVKGRSETVETFLLLGMRDI